MPTSLMPTTYVAAPAPPRKVLQPGTQALSRMAPRNAGGRAPGQRAAPRTRAPTSRRASASRSASRLPVQNPAPPSRRLPARVPTPRHHATPAHPQAQDPAPPQALAQAPPQAQVPSAAQAHARQNKRALSDGPAPSASPPNKRRRRTVVSIDPKLTRKVLKDFASKLYLEHGWTEEEAGKIMGINSSSIRSYTKKLRKEGEDWGITVEPRKPALDDLQSYQSFRKRLGSQVNEEVIFFPELPWRPNQSRDILFSNIRAAKQTLDICIWCISSDELVDLVIGIHSRKKIDPKRAVTVRVVTDRGQSHLCYSRIQKLIKAGVSVHIMGDYHRKLMHNKFVLVDDEVLLHGSYNWSKAAGSGNRESIVITDSNVLIHKFSREFAYLLTQNDE